MENNDDDSNDEDDENMDSRDESDDVLPFNVIPFSLIVLF